MEKLRNSIGYGMKHDFDVQKTTLYKELLAKSKVISVGEILDAVFSVAKKVDPKTFF